MKILTKHEDYQVTLHQSDLSTDGPIVLTFGGQPTDLKSEGFGTEFLLKHGYDTIYVAQKIGTQYQGLADERLKEIVSDCCRNRDVFCYGSSLGGYAATYFGGILDAQIIAAAPMFPSWPPLNRRRFADLRIRHHDLKDGPKSSKAPIIIYDKHIHDDSKLVREMILPAYPNARLVELEYTGHAVLIPMERAGLLKNFILQIIEHDRVTALDLPTEECHLWTLYRGRSLLKEDPVEARRLLERSLSIRPNRPAFEVLLAFFLRNDLLSEANSLLGKGFGPDGAPFKINSGIERLIALKGLNVSTHAQ